MPPQNEHLRTLVRKILDGTGGEAAPLRFSDLAQVVDRHLGIVLGGPGRVPGFVMLPPVKRDGDWCLPVIVAIGQCAALTINGEELERLIAIFQKKP